MRVILATFAAALAAAGCTTAFDAPEAGPAWLDERVQAADAAGGGYPTLSDVPERPSDMPSEAEWRRRVDSLDTKRTDVLANPELAPTAEGESAEAFASEARKKAAEGLDAYDDLPKQQ